MELRLTQDGKTIRGTACYAVLPLVSNGGVVFKDVPVTGMYPTIRVVAQGYNGWTFTGEFEDDGTLSGKWHNDFQTDYPMSLTRGLPAGVTAGCF